MGGLLFLLHPAPYPANPVVRGAGRRPVASGQQRAARRIKPGPGNGHARRLCPCSCWAAAVVIAPERPWVDGQIASVTRPCRPCRGLWWDLGPPVQAAFAKDHAGRALLRGGTGWGRSRKLWVVAHCSSRTASRRCTVHPGADIAMARGIDKSRCCRYQSKASASLLWPLAGQQAGHANCGHTQTTADNGA